MYPNNNLQPQMNSPYFNPITPLLPQGMVWAKGKTEAMNYPMARGTTLPIFDSNEEDLFYIKTVDVYGNTQPLRVFRYEEVTQGEETAITPQEPAVTAEEFNSLKDQISSLREEIKKLSQNHSQSKPYRKDNRNNG